MTSNYHSPVGWLEISASDKALQGIRFLESTPESHGRPRHNIIQQVVAELSEYFRSKRTDFSFPVDPRGTVFQQSVWKQLREIPCGQTTTYGELAGRLGGPRKVRAVGRANGQNPIPIIIPCHRVIGINGNLVGYAGGINRKQFLLKHEGTLLL